MNDTTSRQVAPALQVEREFVLQCAEKAGLIRRWLDEKKYFEITGDEMVSDKLIEFARLVGAATPAPTTEDNTVKFCGIDDTLEQNRYRNMGYAEGYERGAKQEREAIARMIVDTVWWHGKGWHSNIIPSTRQVIAEAILARPTQGASA